MAEKSLENIILYNGSLIELNSRDPNIKYGFGDSLRLTIEIGGGDIEEAFEKAKADIKSMGYDGLVNERTTANSYPNVSLYIIEGTPIVKTYPK